MLHVCAASNTQLLFLIGHNKVKMHLDVIHTPTFCWTKCKKKSSDAYVGDTSMKALPTILSFDKANF